MIELDEFERDGRIWLRGALDEVALAEFEIAADLGDRPGQRFVKGVLEAALGPEQALGRAIGAFDREARAVRVVSFNKTVEANWGVPCHRGSGKTACAGVWELVTQSRDVALRTAFGRVGADAFCAGPFG